MATLKLFKGRLRENYRWLNQKLEESGIKWGVVTKLLCGEKKYLKEVLSLEIDQVLDSRLSHLKFIKELDPNIETVYIKPPVYSEVCDLIKYADISMVSEVETVKEISKETQYHNKQEHKVILSIEMGDLREGILTSELSEFVKDIKDLPGINIYGIGTNLNCLNGTLPTKKIIQKLRDLKQKIEEEFSIKIPFLSGGSSVFLPMLIDNDLSDDGDQLRIGETLFFGKNIVDDSTFEGMHDDVFELSTEIIEVKEKPMIPKGPRASTPYGEKKVFDVNTEKKLGTRAIIDIGLLDVEPRFLKPKNPKIEIIGASSDMLVVDLKGQVDSFSLGDKISFELDYMGVLRLMNSPYVQKMII